MTMSKKDGKEPQPEPKPEPKIWIEVVPKIGKKGGK
jgi:hypothetical protein